MNEIISQIVEWDKDLFLYLNSFHSPFLDHLMWFISGKWEWIPLYLILAILIFKLNRKLFPWVLLFIGITIALTDQLAVIMFKEVFERLRPCHDPGIKEMVHIVNNKCGGKYGFISNHAANSFAMATIVGLYLRKRYKYILLILLLWAGLVSYSRIYLGVHFPADVVGGAFFGFTVAYLIYSVFLYFSSSFLNKNSRKRISG